MADLDALAAKYGGAVTRGIVGRLKSTIEVAAKVVRIAQGGFRL